MTYISQKNLYRHFNSIHIPITAALTAAGITVSPLPAPPLSHNNSLKQLLTSFTPTSTLPHLMEEHSHMHNMMEETETAMRAYLTDLSLPVEQLPTIEELHEQANMESNEAMANNPNVQTLLTLVTVHPSLLLLISPFSPSPCCGSCVPDTGCTKSKARGKGRVTWHHISTGGRGTSQQRACIYF